MKVVAHPLLVAVALGLLAPNALADDGSKRNKDSARAEGSGIDRDQILDALGDSEAPSWARLEMIDEGPSNDEWARAEADWKRVRALKVQ